MRSTTRTAARAVSSWGAVITLFCGWIGIAGAPTAVVAQAQQTQTEKANTDASTPPAGTEPEAAATHSAAPPPAPKKSTFAVQRIELALFGGSLSGATYLELPDIWDPERTRDLGATDILDFHGEPLRSADGEPIRAPIKKIESGTMFGGSATFFLSDRFGLALRGAYGKSQASVSGHTDSDPTRYEWDRSDVSIYQMGASLGYQMSRAKLRPFLTLGFGGILNNFPNTKDVGALYFLYGGGLRYPVSGRWSAFGSFEATLYSYKNDEILYDATVTQPLIAFGFSYRHDVPPPAAPAPVGE